MTHGWYMVQNLCLLYVFPSSMRIKNGTTYSNISKTPSLFHFVFEVLFFVFHDTSYTLSHSRSSLKPDEIQSTSRFVRDSPIINLIRDLLFVGRFTYRPSSPVCPSRSYASGIPWFTFFRTSRYLLLPSFMWSSYQ